MLFAVKVCLLRLPCAELSTVRSDLSEAAHTTHIEQVVPPQKSAFPLLDEPGTGLDAPQGERLYVAV